MDLGLAGKVALVTGSTSGLGLASAKALSAEGASVVICGRRGELARTEAAAMSGPALGVQADLTEPDTPRLLADAAGEAFGPPDILVVSTGGPPPGTAVQVPAEDYDETLRLLVSPVVRLAHLVLPHMRERGWGRLVFVTSAAVREPIAGLVLSNAVRMAVHGFAKTLSKEVAADGVTVNCVLPARIATARVASLDDAVARRTARDAAQVREEAERSIPARRSGDPSELGAVVAFLCSVQAGYVTGASVPVDGGALVAH